MFASFLAAQSTFDDVVAKNRYIDCRDVSYNALPIIERLYTSNKIDSIYQFLDYWESKCGWMESTERLRTILTIKYQQPLDLDSLSTEWIEQLVSYRSRLERSGFPIFGHRYFPQTDIDLLDTQYDSLTREIARSTYSIHTDQSLLLDFYGQDSPTFNRIKAGPQESKLRQWHQEVYQNTRRKPQTHVAFITGVSQHYGNISLFGLRPNFGLVLGGKQLRHNYDILLDFRAGPSRDEYSFIYRDSLVTRDTWTGMYVGAEYTFDFVHTRKLDIGLSPGIGYDRITALTTENDLGEDAKFLSSFNQNLGLVFKYKFGENGGYLGLHFRYNRTSYRNPGGTPLDGEYFNVRFTIGSIANYFRDQKLKHLE